MLLAMRSININKLVKMSGGVKFAELSVVWEDKWWRY
jgi:hypothetical protein